MIVQLILAFIIGMCLGSAPYPWSVIGILSFVGYCFAVSYHFAGRV